MWAEYLTTSAEIDLVHLYGFSAVVRLTHQAGRVPVVIGASTNSYSDLKYYHGWDDRRVKWARTVKRAYLRLIGAYDSSLRPESANYVLTWSDFARKLHLNEGYVRSDQIATIYPGLPSIRPTLRLLDKNDVVTFLFVGRDFERKNGALVLDAFRQVHARCPNTRLLIIGQTSDGRTIEETGVSHRQFVPRTELMDDVFPTADILLLPSKAEGFGLAIVEAMSFGIPAIAVDAWAMPEIIQNHYNGFLIQPNSGTQLTERMLWMATQTEIVNSMRRNCLRTFADKFSVDVHNHKLQLIYKQAMQDATPALKISQHHQGLFRQ
jgi:glycosyltransferase involved in cell wall biosynthesis